MKRRTLITATLSALIPVSTPVRSVTTIETFKAATGNTYYHRTEKPVTWIISSYGAESVIRVSPESKFSVIYRK